MFCFDLCLSVFFGSGVFVCLFWQWWGLNLTPLTECDLKLQCLRHVIKCLCTFSRSRKKWRMLLSDQDLALNLFVVAGIYSFFLLFILRIHLLNSAGGVSLFLHFLSVYNQELSEHVLSAYQ